MKDLIGKKMRVFKADEEGKSTGEVLLEGTFQGVVREVVHKGSFIAEMDVALLYDKKTKHIHKALFEQLVVV